MSMKALGSGTLAAEPLPVEIDGAGGGAGPQQRMGAADSAGVAAKAVADLLPAVPRPWIG